LENSAGSDNGSERARKKLNCLAPLADLSDRYWPLAALHIVDSATKLMSALGES
jgi:hypothetical protein